MKTATPKSLRRASSAAVCFLLLFALTPAVCAEPPSERRPVAITDVTVIDVRHGRALGPRTVLVDAGRIAAITAPRAASIPADAARLDGHGKFLVPGLVDMHVHLFNLSSHRAPNDWSFPLYVAQGVTAVREMNTDAAGIGTIRQWQREVEDGRRVAPRILAAGIAVFGRSPEDAASDVDAAVDAGADFIKVFSEVPAEHWRKILEEARKRSIAVAGHVPADVTLLDAAKAGQRSDEHLMQVYEACSALQTRWMAARRDLGGEKLVAVRDAQEERVLDSLDPAACLRTGKAVATAGQVQVPTLVLAHAEALRTGAAPNTDPRWGYLRADERKRWQRILADPAAHSSPLAWKRWRVSSKIVSLLHRAGVSILAGTDAPMADVYPGFALHDELALLVESGLTPAEALRSATLAPAVFLALDSERGSVDVGKTADLVLLDANPLLDIGNTRRIDAVLLDGRLLRRTDLDALLSAAAEAQRELPD